MKTHEIVTRVVVHDETHLIDCARRQFLNSGNNEDVIETPAQALEELSHVGELGIGRDFSQHLSTPLDCGVEILKREVREVEAPGVPPCFPPEVARAHAAELRQALANLLEWNAQTVRSAAPDWKVAKALMEQIRDEEDAAREER